MVEFAGACEITGAFRAHLLDLLPHDDVHTAAAAAASNDINVLRTGLNSVTQDMKKLSNLMVSIHLCMQSMQSMMQSMIKCGAHAEVVACLSDTGLPESDNKHM